MGKHQILKLVLQTTPPGICKRCYYFAELLPELLEHWLDQDCDIAAVMGVIIAIEEAVPGFMRTVPHLSVHLC